MANPKHRKQGVTRALKASCARARFACACTLQKASSSLAKMLRGVVRGDAVTPTEGVLGDGTSPNNDLHTVISLILSKIDHFVVKNYPLCNGGNRGQKQRLYYLIYIGALTPIIYGSKTTTYKI